MTEDREALILRQVEYYFSDVNLFGDRFLSQKITSNPEGYVELEVLLTFKKLQSEGTTLELLQNSIRKSKKLALNQDATKVKRIIPFTPVIADDINKKSLYISRFPRTASEEEIKAVFLPNKVQHVKFFRNKFSACLTFVEEQEVENVLSNHKQTPHTLQGSTLTLSSYLDKQQKVASEKAKKSFEGQKKNRKRKSEADVEMDSGNKSKKKKVSVAAGSTIQFTVSVPSKKLKANFLRKIFEKHGTVDFLDSPNSGQLFGIKCFVRYQTPEQAQTAFEKLVPEYQNQIEFVHLDANACKEYEVKVNKVIDRKNVLVGMAT